MKSGFRTKIEEAVNKVTGGPLITNTPYVFLDRNKCSDRLKFAFRVANTTQLDAIKANVESIYPDKEVVVLSSRDDPKPSYINRWYGVSISVKHDANKRLN